MRPEKVSDDWEVIDSEPLDGLSDQRAEEMLGEAVEEVGYNDDIDELVDQLGIETENSGNPDVYRIGDGSQRYAVIGNNITVVKQTEVSGIYLEDF